MNVLQDIKLNKKKMLNIVNDLFHTNKIIYT